jgi:hypothetical protein
MKRIVTFWISIIIILVVLCVIIAANISSETSVPKDVLFAIVGMLLGLVASFGFYLLRPNITVGIENPELSNKHRYIFKIFNGSRYDSVNLEYELKVAYPHNGNTLTDTYKMHRYLVLRNKSEQENFITCAIDKNKFKELTTRFKERNKIVQTGDLYFFIRISLQHGLSNFTGVFQYNYDLNKEEHLVLSDIKKI